MWLCTCGSDGLTLGDPKDWDGLVPITMWRSGYWKEGLWTRLKHIWHIIRYGHPYIDSLLLTPEAAEDVARQLAAYSAEGRLIMKGEQKWYTE